MATKSLELRKLMKQQKSTNSHSKKINHPLAKYNNLDQLLCIICNAVIKNEVIWCAHLQSKKHKENVLKLKAAPTKSTAAVNKSAPPPKKGILKKNEPSDDNLEKATQNLPTDFFDESAKETTSDSTPLSVEKGETKQDLPSDFFDDNTSEDKKLDASESASRKRKASSTSEQLPEGFFDDPKQDAKARNIEYKDPKDAEWEKFQKMIQEETKIAENIQDEEDEESEMLKDLTELNTMKSCLSRVENLKKVMKKNTLKKQQKDQQVNNAKGSPKQEDETLSESDEEDFEKLFDWRSKTA